MALAIIFAFFADLEERKFVRFLMVVLVCSLIHTTALLSLGWLVVYLLLYPQKKISAVKPWYLLGLSALVVIGTVCLLPTVKLLMQIGILSDKYTFFFAEEYSRMSFTRLALLIIEAVGILFCYKKFRSDISCGEYYLMHTVIFMCMQQLAQFVVYGHRLVLYFALPNIVTILSIPRMMSDMKLQLPVLGTITLDSKQLRVLAYVIILVLTCYYWYYQYVGARSSETYPYIFGF
jgi:hypothetical protein